jgi:hypothetical protein
MTNEQSEILDKALQRLPKDPGMGFELTLEGEKSAIDLMVAAAGMVQALPVLAAPSPALAAADREAFLARVEQLPAPITPPPGAGFLAWLSQFLPTRTQAGVGSSAMMPALVKGIVLLVVVIMATLGGTAAMSASALPTSPIYPVKLLVEEARLSITNNPADQAALYLAFAGERAEEMARLAAFNRAPEQAQLENYRANWRQALQLAGQLPDEELLRLMAQAQALAGEQENALSQAQLGAAQRTQERLQEAGFSIAQVKTAVQLGLQNQERFRWHMQNISEDWPGVPHNFGPDPGDCEADCDSEEGFVPVPGYGPGEPGSAGPGSEEPGEDAPVIEEPGDEDPGSTPPADEDPGDEAPGDEDPGDGRPGNDDPGFQDPGDDFPGHGDPGRDDPGNEGPGNDDSGNGAPGNGGPGNESPGNGDPGNDGPGNDDPGNDGPGNDGPGNDDPGNDDPGNEDPGNDGPGDEDPGNDDPGNENPGDDDPGNEDPGNENDDPGNDDPGSGEPGDDDPGNGDPGDGSPGDGGPGDGDPGNDDPGNENPGDGGPGQNNDPGKQAPDRQ